MNASSVLNLYLSRDEHFARYPGSDLHLLSRPEIPVWTGLDWTGRLVLIDGIMTSEKEPLQVTSNHMMLKTSTKAIHFYRTRIKLVDMTMARWSSFTFANTRVIKQGNDKVPTPFADFKKPPILVLHQFRMCRSGMSKDPILTFKRGVVLVLFMIMEHFLDISDCVVAVLSSNSGFFSP